MTTLDLHHLIAVDTVGQRHRLISAAGIVALVFVAVIVSTHPLKINWPQVCWGLGLQFAFAILILRWELGKAVIDCLGAKGKAN